MKEKPALLIKRMGRKPFCVLGIDLAGVEHRPTGVCILRISRAETFLLYKDTEILSRYVISEMHTSDFDEMAFRLF